MPPHQAPSPLSTKNTPQKLNKTVVFVGNISIELTGEAPSPFIAAPVDILPQFLSAKAETIRHYRFTHSDGSSFTQPFILYAPSLLGLWALVARHQNPALITHIISDIESDTFGFWFLLRLRFLLERFRLGSDAISLYAQQTLAHYGIQANFSITQWLDWLNTAKTITPQIFIRKMPQSQKDWDDLFSASKQTEQT